MLVLELTTHRQRRVTWDSPDLIERTAPASCTQHFATEMPSVARDAVRFGELIGLRHDHLLAAECFGGLGLCRGTGRYLDLQFRLEVGDHLLRVGIALG